MSTTQRIEPHERLAHARREAGFSTASEAARAFGWNENTYRSHENGERGIKQNIAEIYARAFHTTASYILFGDEDIFWRSGVLLAGTVGPGGKVSFSPASTNEKNTQIAQMAIMFNHDVVGFKVGEDANIAVFQPGDLIVTWALEHKPAAAIENYALVRTAGEEWMLKLVRQGDVRSRFHLEMPFQPTLTNVHILDALPVHAIIPRSQWSQVDAPPKPLKKTA